MATSPFAVGVVDKAGMGAAGIKTAALHIRCTIFNCVQHKCFTLSNSLRIFVLYSS